MARPVEFDPEEALCAAIKLFASHGYEGSSTAELLARMGIARQSLYGTFGDKRRLFLKALEHYNAGSVAELVATLGSKRDRLEALEAALLAFAKPGAEPEAGCLGLGSITEFGRSDDEINAINDASARALLTALASHIRDGRGGGRHRRCRSGGGGPVPAGREVGPRGRRARRRRFRCLARHRPDGAAQPAALIPPAASGAVRPAGGGLLRSAGMVARSRAWMSFAAIG